MNAKRVLASHNELSAAYNGLVEKYNKTTLKLHEANKKVDSLIKQIDTEQNGLTYGVDLGFKEGDRHVEPNKDVDAISILFRKRRQSSTSLGVCDGYIQVS